jgi:gamma-glutamyltranspeptidase / glutathione hydrolase / leukotriene-C4 hydrolase
MIYNLYIFFTIHKKQDYNFFIYTFSFGAGLTGKRTGIIFNSGMDDFSSPGLKNYFGLPGSKPNFIKPYKRALSSMSPVIITNENGIVEMVIGAAGGTKIPTAVTMV